GVVVPGPFSDALHLLASHLSPQGYSLFLPASGSQAAAFSHSASIGSRTPSPDQRQYSAASHQETLTTGCSGVSEHLVLSLACPGIMASYSSFVTGKE